MKTKEGLTIKNIKHFPSMEWGDEGGTSCDIYLNNVKIGDYFNDGNGGNGVVNLSTMHQKDFEEMCYQINKRLDPKGFAEFGEDILRMSPFDTTVALLEEVWDAEKFYAKTLRKIEESSFKLFKVNCDFESFYAIRGNLETAEQVIDHFKQKGHTVVDIKCYDSVSQFNNI